jgi:hypothetical protein
MDVSSFSLPHLELQGPLWTRFIIDGCFQVWQSRVAQDSVELTHETEAMKPETGHQDLARTAKKAPVNIQTIGPQEMTRNFHARIFSPSGPEGWKQKALQDISAKW